MRRCLWVAGCMGAAVLSACAVLRPQAVPSPTSQAAAPSRPGPLRITQAAGDAQTGSGRAAPFVLCRGDACSQVTPKTLAQAPRQRNVETSQDQGADQATPLSGLRVPPEPSAEHSAASAGHEASAATAAAATGPSRLNIPNAPHRAAESLPRDIALTVRFRFGESRLTDDARSLLDASARQSSAAGPYSRLRIVGRTDSLGPQAVNDALAMARARAVRDHLRNRLARWPAAVDIEAAGACCYAASNDTSDGRLANRRVEVTWSASDPEASP